MPFTISSTFVTSARTYARAVAPFAILAVASACALDATNPGPIQADALNAPTALGSIVSGSGRDLSEALNWVAYTGGAASREIFPGGSSGAFGITVQQQNGRLTDDDGGTWWDFSQRARWTAEDAVARAKVALGTAAASNATHAQALIWAGFSNRVRMYPETGAPARGALESIIPRMETIQIRHGSAG